MKETIEIPVEWIKRLLEVTESVKETDEYGYYRYQRIAQLLGYIESAKILINKIKQ